MGDRANAQLTAHADSNKLKRNRRVATAVVGRRLCFRSIEPLPRIQMDFIIAAPYTAPSAYHGPRRQCTASVAV